MPFVFASGCCASAEKWLVACSAVLYLVEVQAELKESGVNCCSVAGKEATLVTWLAAAFSARF